MDQVEEIKQKADILQIIGEYVQLKKAGVNWKGRCPFHNEKTPSFMVNPDRNIWHCFGCGEGGDVYSFIQKIEGLEFPEALKLLGDKTGVKIERFDPRVSSQKNRLMDICSAATGHWQTLLNSPVGEKARNYLQKRGVSSSVIQTFKFGYALDSWDDLLKFLKNKGYSEQDIFTAGLSVQKNSGSGYYDRFRDRLIFPIQDIHGNVIGFTGRAFKDDDGAKYINSPENPIYHKGKVIYGLDKAKQQIRESGYVVIVEGNMDVVACHQAGFKNVVACSGTALTIDQIQVLKRYTENVALCFDQDEAGQRAAQRSIDLLLTSEVNIKIIQLEFGKDPDECIHHDIGCWERSLRNSKLFMDYYLDKYLTGVNLNDIYKKKQVTKIILEQLSKLENKIEQTHWLQVVSNKLDVSEKILRESLFKVAVPNSPIKKEQIQKLERSEKIEKSVEIKYLERILTILINYPSLIGYASEHLDPVMITDQTVLDFYKKVIIYYNKNENATRSQVVEWLGENKDLSESYKDSLIVYIEQIYEGFNQNDLTQELISLITAFKVNHFTEEVKKLNKQLATAESEKNRELSNEIIKKIQYVSENLDKLK